MSILVTGGAGYIGSHTAKVLAASGHQPVVLDNFSHGHDWAVKWGPLERGEPRRPEFLKGVFARHAIDASSISPRTRYVGESMTDPRKYFRQQHGQHAEPARRDDRSRRGHVRLLLDVRDLRRPGPRPDRRDAPADAGESVRRVQADGREDAPLVRRGLWTAVRSRCATSTPPEPIPDGEIGEDHDPETHLIPLVIDAAQGTRPPVRVFGTDYPTPDGTAIRDYIHVMDLADAHLRALDRLGSGRRARRSISAPARATQSGKW